MRKSSAIASGMVLFAMGFAFGTFSSQTPQLLKAQDEASAAEISKDVLETYKKTHKAVRELSNLFVAGGQSTSAFGGLNYFATSVGGIDAERDLEEGRGVDPETFAALYADIASPKIAEHLDFDEQGRLRYKKNVIRIYARDRLKQLFQKRDQLVDRSEANE